MKKARVLIHGTPSSTVVVEHGATAGATFGKDIRTEGGQVLSLQALIAMAVGAMPAPPPVSATDWTLVASIPPKVKALENATGSTGIFSVTGAGTGALQELEVGASSAVSLSIVNPGGVAGPPMFILDPTLNALSPNNWAANAFPIGTGPDTLAQVLFGANTFPARASTGDLEDKPITDTALVFLAAATQADMRAAIDAEQDGAASAALTAANTYTDGEIASLSSVYQPLISYAANQFGARGSVGAYGAQTITDNALLLLADANVPRLGTSNIWGGTSQYSSANFFIQGTSLVTADTQRMALSAAASTSTARTGVIFIHGVNHATLPGIISLNAGTGADLVMNPGVGGSLRANTDNTRPLGTASFRWTEVFAANGTINTSDARDKTALIALTDDEIAASRDLAREIGTFQWLDSLAKKGEAARHHVGLTVQRVCEIMGQHGLDPVRYGFICHDEWGALPEVWEEWEEQVDDEGVVIVPAGRERIQIAREAGDRWGFRTDQLLLFITIGIDARLRALESK